MPIKHLFRPIQMTLAALTIGVAVSAGAASSVAPPVIGPSGMPTQAWFKESSNDLARDLADAVKSGKRLAIVWEQRGCYYCKRMHDVNFQVRDVVDYVRARFEFVQLNLRGNRVLMDLDGNPVTEAMLARKNRVTGTPTVQFLDGKGKEVFRMPGSRYITPRRVWASAFPCSAESLYHFRALP
jgi:thioredoxin-related protein